MHWNVLVYYQKSFDLSTKAYVLHKLECFSILPEEL